jgi:U3 small nucleolar ribonucleoprotein protein IMP4
LEAQERQTYERKRQLKDALASGKPLPTELKKDAKNLGRDLGFDEAQTGQYVTVAINPNANFMHGCAE